MRVFASLATSHQPLATLPLLLLTGCVGQYVPGYVPPPTAAVAAPQQSAPILIPNMDRDLVWNQMVDVMDDYFKVEREDRVKLIGDILTEGTLTTYPRTGSTIFEPWNTDSVTPYERMESTLQSIRRKSIVRVTPAEGGFLVDVAVFKELEDVARPESFGATAANLRNDDSVQRFTNPVGGQPLSIGWIPLGRDVALEQSILGQLQARFGGPVMLAPPAGVRAF